MKVRWVSFVAAVAYPIWCPLYQIVLDQPYDPLWQRLLFALFPFASFIASYSRKISSRKLETLYHLFVYALTAHVFFLVYKNEMSTPYILGAYCMVFSAGLGPLSEKSQWRYIVFMLTLIGTLCVLKPQENTYFLASGALTSAGVAYASQRAILYLIDQLRTSRLQIHDKNVVLDNMLNSLGQGFLSFDREGRCLPVYSHACEALLETKPAGQFIWDVLREPAEIASVLKSRIHAAFDHESTITELIALLPTQASHAKGRHIVLSYRPVLKASGGVSEVVVVATDQTDLLAAQNEADKERRQALMIGSIISQKYFFQLFLAELRTGLSHLDDTLNDQAAADNFKRFLHSMKGGANIFLMQEFATFIHGLEEEWSGRVFEAYSDTRAFIHRQAVALENELNQFLAAHSALKSEFGTERFIEIPFSEFDRVINKADFAEAPASIQDDVVGWTLKPIGAYFGAHFALCRRQAEMHVKELAPILVEGADLMILPEAYADLISSCVHLFSNFIEHGLESPMERTVLGKPSAGTLKVSFSRRGDGPQTVLVIEVQDDGRGIDPAKIREKMSRNGHTQEAQNLSDDEVINWIFSPGFSTRETVTEGAGRGVGLSALQFSAQALGGSVKVKSQLGAGSVFTIRVPDVKARTYLGQRTRPVAA